MIEKILFEHRLFGHQRFVAQVVGPVPHAAITRSIELLGAVVAPAVRGALGAAPQPGAEACPSVYSVSRAD